jgi:hypothetical protein
MQVLSADVVGSSIRAAFEWREGAFDLLLCVPSGFQYSPARGLGGMAMGLARVKYILPEESLTTSARLVTQKLSC